MPIFTILKTYGLYPSHVALQVPTLLGVVVSVCTPLPTRTQQLPTLLAQQCWELLRPFARSLKEDCKLVYMYLCPSGTLEQWNQISGPSHLEKKTHFYEKKKDKGKERKKRKERPFALTESYLHCYSKSERERFFIRSRRGGTRWIYHIPLRSR